MPKFDQQSPTDNNGSLMPYPYQRTVQNNAGVTTGLIVTLRLESGHRSLIKSLTMERYGTTATTFSFVLYEADPDGLSGSDLTEIKVATSSGGTPTAVAALPRECFVHNEEATADPAYLYLVVTTSHTDSFTFRMEAVYTG